MRRLRRWLAALAVPAAVLTTVALAAPAASAGTVPGSLGQAASQARHHHGLRPEFFTIRIVNSGTSNNPGVVNAFGPVRGIGGTDVEQNNTMGVFSFNGPVRSVNVFHSDVSNVNPVIDRRSCTAFASADGAWAFGGGTGRYLNATGFGTFHFTLFLKLQRKHHRCDMNMNDPVRLSVVNVTGTGLASRN